MGPGGQSCGMVAMRQVEGQIRGSLSHDPTRTGQGPLGGTPPPPPLSGWLKTIRWIRLVLGGELS